MDIDNMPAGCTLDKLVAEKVMGWREEDGYYYDVKGGIRSLLYDFNPSVDIASAWEVVEKLDLFRKYYLTHDSIDEWSIYLHDYDMEWFAGGPTAPVAICRAALRKLDL